MTAAEVTQAARDHGLPGWKAGVHAHPEIAGRRVAVLTSPDYNPVTGAGRMIAAAGRDDADAFARALERARGALD
ncbi:hypothetical protein [Brevundimonas sp.]|uniref:hypothetical protein n=1 Tax=Brevundimonas sp. TaxID=1871086 RepID=UPI0028A11C2C|nr:hypothetical protein [Brevundimonas sp.]